jgi:hypothetical protein
MTGPFHGSLTNEILEQSADRTSLQLIFSAILFFVDAAINSLQDSVDIGIRRRLSTRFAA